MKYADLRDSIAQLERRGELKRIAVEVDPRLEMTEICDRVLKSGGPALLFEKPKGHAIPVLGNLFGTPLRVALGLGEESVASLAEVGKLLAYLKEPEPPKGLRDAWQNTRPVLMQVMHMAAKARAPRSSNASGTNCVCRRPPRSCSKASSGPMRPIPQVMRPRSKVHSAITPATTTRPSASRCSPSSASPCAATRSITARTRASRPTSLPCSASR